MASNVVVNLNVNANASGTIDIFGQTTIPTISGNVIVAEKTLPVSDLYVNSSNSLVKFQGSNNDILATRDSTFTTNTTTMLTDLSTIISGPFNCSNAQPFSLPKYNNIYNTQNNFGYVVLGCYADKLFGHLAATAAIDNDTSLVNYITSNGASGANISSNLVNAIFNMSDSNATAIAKQVIGQDASRATNQDNDMNAPSVYQALKFMAGDVIYMSATIQPPTITSGSGQLSVPVNYTGDTTYLMKITLANPYPAPVNIYIDGKLANGLNLTYKFVSQKNITIVIYDNNGVNITALTPSPWPNTDPFVINMRSNNGSYRIYYMFDYAQSTLTVSYGGFTQTASVTLASSGI